MPPTPVIAAVGMFDGVHNGHKYLFQQLKAEAHARGLGCLAVSFPNHPLQILNPAIAPELITPSPREKKLLIEAQGVDCRMLPFTPELSRLTAREFMAFLKEKEGVEAILLGFNHRFGSDRLKSHDDYRREGRAVGIEILSGLPLLLPDGSEVSSSAVRKAVDAKYFNLAEELLGRPWEFAGRVVHGDAIGRTLGFPTANIDVDPNQVLPPQGVYAAEIFTEHGLSFPAAVNIGFRPTLGLDKNEKKPRVEAFIIGWKGDLYNQRLRVVIRQFIRAEQKFESLAQLRHAISADALQTSQIINNL